MLNLKTFLIKQQAGLVKLASTYDIFDANTNAQVGVAKEEPSGLVSVLRFFMSKKTLPTKISVYPQGGNKAVFTIKRGFTFLRSKVTVHDANDAMVGYFQSKLMSIGAGFWVYDNKDQQFAEVKGDWKGWNFQLLTKDGQEIGSISKKFAGLAKELFTSADNYVVALNDKAPSGENSAMLLLAAGLAVDTIFKEGD